MWKRLLGDAHPDVAQSLNNLAAFYDNQGHYSEAKTLYQAALAMCKRLLGDEHPNVCRYSDNLAMLYSAQEKTEEAEIFTQKL